MKVLHFKRKLWLQVWFPSVPNGLVVAGAHYSEHPYQLYPWVNPVPYLFIFSHEEKTSPHIFLRPYVSTFEQEDKNRRGSSSTWNRPARKYNVHGTRRTWLLESGHVTLDVCSHICIQKQTWTLTFGCQGLIDCRDIYNRSCIFIPDRNHHI